MLDTPLFANVSSSMRAAALEPKIRLETDSADCLMSASLLPASDTRSPNTPVGRESNNSGSYSLTPDTQQLDKTCIIQKKSRISEENSTVSQQLVNSLSSTIPQGSSPTCTNVSPVLTEGRTLPKISRNTAVAAGSKSLVRGRYQLLAEQSRDTFTALNEKSLTNEVYDAVSYKRLPPMQSRIPHSITSHAADAMTSVRASQNSANQEMGKSVSNSNCISHTSKTQNSRLPVPTGKLLGATVDVPSFANQVNLVID